VYIETDLCWSLIVVYYKSIKRELKKRCIYECRCDERLQTKTRDLHVSHTLFVYYESMNRYLKIKPIYECRCVHLKIKTRLTNEKFASVKGESARMFIFQHPRRRKPVLFFNKKNLDCSLDLSSSATPH
jgi:hypothetical protein